MITVKYMQDVFNFALDVINRKCTKNIIVQDYTNMQGFRYKNELMCVVSESRLSFFNDNFLKGAAFEYSIIDFSGVRYKNKVLNEFENFSEQDLFAYSTVLSTDEILSLYLCTEFWKISSEIQYILNVPLIHEYFKDNILCRN